jgi:hypothetical protein
VIEVVEDVEVIEERRRRSLDYFDHPRRPQV